MSGSLEKWPEGKPEGQTGGQIEGRTEAIPNDPSAEVGAPNQI